jgi:hypothetical protein
MQAAQAAEYAAARGGLPVQDNISTKTPELQQLKQYIHPIHPWFPGYPTWTQRFLSTGLDHCNMMLAVAFYCCFVESTACQLNLEPTAVSYCR